MIKKQRKLIIFIAAAVAVLAAVYIVLMNTLLKPADPTPNPSGGNIRLFEEIERTKIDRIVVHNEHGSFTVYTGTDGELYFEGAESQIYDSLMLASLLAGTGSLTASQEVQGYTAEDLSIYGLADGEYLASFSITSVDDPAAVHTVRIGNPLVNGNGYYAMVDGRDALYVVGNYVSAALFSDIKEFFAPQVAIPALTDDTHFLDRYSMTVKGELLYTVIPTVPEEGSALVSQYMYAYAFSYPDERLVNNITYNTVLQGLKSLAGKSVKEYSVNESVKALQTYLSDTTGITPDSELGKKAYEAVLLLQKYGLLTEDYLFPRVLEFECNDIFSSVIISDITEDNTFYVYSETFDLIAEFDAAGYEWLFWDADQFYIYTLLNLSIRDLAKFEITSPAVSASFELTTSGNDDSNEVIKVVDALSGKEVNVDLFKQMYRGFLYIAELGPAQQGDHTTPSLTVKVTVVDGTETEFVFYDISDRKCFYTVNGVGSGGYVNRDYVVAMITYVQNVLDGQQFTSTIL